MMRRVFAPLTAAAFIVVLGAATFAAAETIKGKVIDRECYLLDKTNTGNEHKNGTSKMPKDCATACAQLGRAVALLTADGKVYTIAGDLAANRNEKLVPHITHTVEVTGAVTEAGGKMTIAGSSLKMISN